ncbi:hypothetical protein P4H35_20315 [Paenibacillus taichungensis]|uniref:hypothetical protein n=1 Tax=Paenibacillus taichungensis TaxID=484184 RepID=UPI002DBCE161|nr:hypothetical protein [Paenibacillus taichungensis]MEC0198689.1 hypothetical protein [Paenibacillus taichungensis]
MSSDWVRYFFEIESDIVSWCSFVVKRKERLRRIISKSILLVKGNNFEELLPNIVNKGALLHSSLFTGMGVMDCFS